MNIYAYQTPPMWWSPKLSVLWVKLFKGMRKFARQEKLKVVDVEIQNIDKLFTVINEGCGVLITPNHSSHADPLVMYKVCDDIKLAFYFMAAWQIFEKANWFRKLNFRLHGCFSVDREGTDMRAFRQAVDVLKAKKNPLVIFPEGEIYHVNDRVTPFRDGPAAIAITAAKRSDGRVVCVPCGVKYLYVDDPTEELEKVMARLEDHLLWRVRRDQTLDERVYRFAEAMLGVKELEYLGQNQTGSLTERIKNLSETILKKLEDQYGISPAEQHTLPERVKTCRREAIKKLESDDPKSQAEAKDYLDDVMVVAQLFSYPGEYVSSKPTIERIAETIDKFEEDILKSPEAGIRGKRKAIIRFGDPIEVSIDKDKKKDAVRRLTNQLESSVQGLLDEISGTL
ncbi:MAG: 1-acyl-sn-glycerol-3-phosphate acyltransferase [Planctomycetes bacterium]|nr:1-acyl-sn-glycerol-3-phosphate acyltransferase [Planctomycetota bacterium]